MFQHGRSHQGVTSPDNSVGPTPRTAEDLWEQKGTKAVETTIYSLICIVSTFSVVRTCKDTLGTVICEDIEIKKLKPQINDMESNGFIFRFITANIVIVVQVDLPVKCYSDCIDAILLALH